MMCDENCCKRCRRRIASAYLLRLRGYEEAAMILKNRYEYALYVHKPEADYLLSEFREMEREENMVRRELFRSLSAMDNDYSRKVLWQLYIERKQPDEAAKWLPLDDLLQVNWLPADVLVIREIERTEERTVTRELTFTPEN